MRLLFVRHGETVDNVEGKLQGQTDGVLTTLGENQVKNIVNKLRDYDIGFVYCSDLGRTKRTLDIIREELVLPEPIYLRELRERDPGKYVGSIMVELTQQDFENIRNGDSGGESDEEMVNRVRLFFSKVTSLRGVKPILVVTHNGFIKFFVRYIVGNNLKNLIGHSSFPHGSIGIIDIDDKNEAQFIELIGLD